MFGVFMIEPWKPTSLQPRSSARMNRMWGGLEFFEPCNSTEFGNKTNRRRVATWHKKTAIIRLLVKILLLLWFGSRVQQYHFTSLNWYLSVRLKLACFAGYKIRELANKGVIRNQISWKLSKYKTKPRTVCHAPLQRSRLTVNPRISAHPKFCRRQGGRA